MSTRFKITLVYIFIAAALIFIIANPDYISPQRRKYKAAEKHILVIKQALSQYPDYKNIEAGIQTGIINIGLFGEIKSEAARQEIMKIVAATKPPVLIRDHLQLSAKPVQPESGPALPAPQAAPDPQALAEILKGIRSGDSNALVNAFKMRIREALPAIVDGYDKLGPLCLDVIFLFFTTVPDQRDIPYLLTLLKHPNKSIQGEAIYALGNLRDKEAVPELMKIPDDDPNKQIAMEALSRIGAAETIPALTEYMLRHKNLPIMQNLSELKITNTIPALINLLDNTESWDDWSDDICFQPQVRGEAALALGKIGAQEAIPKLLELLNKVKDNTDNDEELKVAMKTAQALGLLKATEAFPVLMRILSKSAGKRYVFLAKVVRAVGQIGIKEAAPALRPFLTEKFHIDMYLETIRALAQLGDTESIPLLKELINHKDAQVSQAAVDALKTLGLSEPEINQLRDPELYKKRYSKELAMLSSPDPWARGYAVNILAQELVKETIPNIKALLSDPEEKVRAAAEEALKKLGLTDEEIQKAKEGKK